MRVLDVFMRQKSSFFGFLVLIILIVGGLPTLGRTAESGQLISKDKVYLAVLFRRHREKPFAGALFCPEQGGQFRGCKQKTGHVFGAFKWNIATDWYTRRPRNTPKMLFDSVDFSRSGRHVMVLGASGNSVIRPDGVTYYFDAKPGTVFVIPARGQSMAEAVTAARNILREERPNSNIDILKFKPIKAARFTCSGGKKGNCTLGQDVDPRSLGRSW